MVYRVLSLTAVIAVFNVLPASGEDADQQQCQQCPISAAVAKLPQLTYVVADETCNCPKSAATKAESLGVPVVFAVGKTTNYNQKQAKHALVNPTQTKNKKK